MKECVKNIRRALGESVFDVRSGLKISPRKHVTENENVVVYSVLIGMRYRLFWSKILKFSKASNCIFQKKKKRKKCASDYNRLIMSKILENGFQTN